VFIAFDILYQDSELLMDKPLRERRATLDALATNCGVGILPTYSSQTQPARGQDAHATNLVMTTVIEVSAADQIDAVFARARDRRNEGLVLKDPDSTYSPGRRGQAWLKLKTHLPTIDCVVTAAEYGHGKRRGVLSDYTLAVWDREPSEPEGKLVNIGKAFSGVTDEEIAQLTKIFLDLSLGQRGHVHPVRPKIVLEIACDQIQKSKRHASGYAMRFPRIKRIRWDKNPEDADRVSQVVELYGSMANTARSDPADQPQGSEPTLFDGL
jgi:DNA ligase-1